MITINVDPTVLMLDIVNREGIGIRRGMLETSLKLLSEIHRTFDLQGPGWKPLKDITIKRKISSGAPIPEKILEEFGVMRGSLKVKSDLLAGFPEVFLFSFAVENQTMIDVETLVNFDEIQYEKERIRSSVGLFSNDSLKYDPETQAGYKGPLDVVSRGIKHEFGGVETQHLTRPVKQVKIGVETIRTARGIDDRLLKGEAVDLREVKKVGKMKRNIRKKKEVIGTRIVMIPERSFLRKTFDRELNNLIETMGKEIGDAME